MDYVGQLDGGQAAYRVGKRMILPSTYAGAPRALQQNYLDAMAIVRKTGKPDYFITMTANPSWPEVTAALRPGEKAHDRPDLMARVFYLKWKQLLHELLDKHILGVDIAYCWVIEFQKRSLPHGHILMTVAGPDKVRDTSDIDARVCAEFPLYPDGRQQELFQVIRTGMVHGPCGQRNPKAPCMDAGRCQKGYPKDFAECTEFNDGYFPTYRRRDSGATPLKGGTPFDNRDVVPYNPYLSRRFECHINVELVASLKSVKYIYKYVHKGHDRAELAFRFQNDEIAAHIDARYVGPSEGCWRLFGFPLHAMSHNVERLAVHLPGMQACMYEEGAEREACEQAQERSTTLLAWFALNSKSEKFHDVLYMNIPQHCVWDRRNTCWVERKRGFNNVIGRLSGASPVEQERYYLYLLLLHVPGARGWEDLKRTPGLDEPAGTFQEAAILRGLVDDEEEYRRAMADACDLKMPRPLRTFFAHLLLNCGIASGEPYWDEFKEKLAEDYSRSQPLDVALDHALKDIQTVLETAGKKNSDFNLPAPSDFDHAAWMGRELRAEMDFDGEAEREKASSMRAQMYTEQREAFDAVLAAVDCESEAMFFVDGPGGSGKSFLFEGILHHVRGKGDIGIACAWSGLAATLLPGGRTVSSRFGLPVPLPENEVQYGVTASHAKGRLLQAARIIVWDEISMTPLEALEAADACLKDVCQNDLPFGGKVVVFGGDFRQVLPVVPRADAERIKSHAVTRHPYFAKGLVRRFTLATNMRASQDKPYSEFLLQVGGGTFPGVYADGATQIRVPDVLLAPGGTTVKSMAAWVFDDVVAVGMACLQSADTAVDARRHLGSRAVLAPKNVDVDAFNRELLTNFPKDSMREYFSSDGRLDYTCPVLCSITILIFDFPIDGTP